MIDGNDIADLIEADDAVVGPYAANYFWDDRSRLKIHWDEEAVHYGDLYSASGGLYTFLCERLPEYCAGHGIKRFTARPSDPEAERILLKRGDWERQEDGLLVWNISE